MKQKIKELIKQKAGVNLSIDIGCGGKKQPNFIGIDKRAMPGVDIVHDLEKFPYPLPDDCCLTIMASHIIEHIKPWLTVDMFNELWRIMKAGGRMAMATPFAGSKPYWQDPTHCNGFNQVTFQYFDPRYPLYDTYEPKPWQILKGWPQYHANGNLEVIMEKITIEEGNKVAEKRRKEDAEKEAKANE